MPVKRCPVRHEGIDLTGRVLRWLVQQNQQPCKATGKIRQDAFRLGFTLEGADAQIGLGADAARLADERRAEYPVRIGVAVTCARRGPPDENLPFVDDLDAHFHILSGDVAGAAVLVDQYVAISLGLSPFERCLKGKRLSGTHQAVKSFVLRQLQACSLRGFDGDDLFQNRQPVVEADEHVRAWLHQRPHGSGDRPILEMRPDAARSWGIAIPEEVTHAPLEPHAGKHIRRAEVVVEGADAIVAEHALSKFIEPFAANQREGSRVTDSAAPASSPAPRTTGKWARRFSQSRHLRADTAGYR